MMLKCGTGLVMASVACNVPSPQERCFMCCWSFFLARVPPVCVPYLPEFCHKFHLSHSLILAKTFNTAWHYVCVIVTIYIRLTPIKGGPASLLPTTDLTGSPSPPTFTPGSATSIFSQAITSSGGKSSLHTTTPLTRLTHPSPGTRTFTLQEPITLLTSNHTS